MPASLMKVEAELTRVQEDEKHLLQLLTEEAEKMLVELFVWIIII